MARSNSEKSQESFVFHPNLGFPVYDISNF